MGIGDRFPNWISERDIQIQIFGPSSGRCAIILNGVADYLQDSRFEDVTVVPLDVSPNLSQKIGTSDGAVFVFLHPDHSKLNDPRELNQPVIDGLEHWVIGNPSRTDNTYLIFEGIEGEIVQDYSEETENISELFAEVTDESVEKGELEAMRENILSQCADFEL